MSFSCRLVVEGEVVHVYHTQQNSRVYHETELDSLEFGLEVIISSVCLLLSTQHQHNSQRPGMQKERNSRCYTNNTLFTRKVLLNPWKFGDGGQSLEKQNFYFWTWVFSSFSYSVDWAWPRKAYVFKAPCRDACVKVIIVGTLFDWVSLKSKPK